MSRSPFFFLEKVDGTTGKATLVTVQILKQDGSTESVDLFPYNGCHDLFSIVEENSGDIPAMGGIHRGLPFGASDRIKQEYEFCKRYGGTFRWFFYSDLLVYSLNFPKIKSVDDEGNTIMIDNPIFTLKNRVDSFIEVWDSWSGDNSLYRIVYWIDY